MLNIGPLELMVILVVALLVVGPKRLPEVGRSIGRGLREFRRAQDEVQRTLKLGLDESAEPAAAGTPTPGAPATPDGGGPASTPTKASDVDDAAAALGQGIAELRRVREELQRSFRVDVDDARSAVPSTPTAAAPPAPAEEHRDEPPPGSAGEAG